MESYRFVDLFETKGLEYILLLSFLVLLVALLQYLAPVNKDGKHNR